MTKFRHITEIDAPREFAFRWHQNPGAFERLAPPWQPLELAEKIGGLEDGARLSFYIKKGPFALKWVAEHFDYIENEQFCDFQVKGPFKRWRHKHKFEDAGRNGCRIVDELQYTAPLGPLNSFIPRFLLSDMIQAMFNYRGAVVKHDVETHHRWNLEPQRVLITGSSGLVGSALIPFLSSGGHIPVRALRKRQDTREESIIWNPKEGFDDETLKQVEGMNAVVNLAGENIMGLWTKEKKRRIRDSRIETTRNLCESLAKLDKKPEVLISASAIGVYGDRSEEELTEESALAESGFLTEVGRDWEEATKPAEEAGIRVVCLRIGVVLHPQGGALAAMLPAAMSGVLGKLGSGKQWMSWIALNDLVRLIHHCIANREVRGAVNAVAPGPVTNQEFTKTLGSVLYRPTFLSVPEFALRSVANELAENMLLASMKVSPQAALESGFRFEHTTLRRALIQLLGKLDTA